MKLDKNKENMENHAEINVENHAEINMENHAEINMENHADNRVENYAEINVVAILETMIDTIVSKALDETLDKALTDKSPSDKAPTDKSPTDKAPSESTVYTYRHNDVMYVDTFPEDWAKSHLPETGPVECLNCQTYGVIEDVFYGYCANCADYCYAGSRGKGYIDKGVFDGENDTDACVDVSYDMSLDISDEDLYSEYYRDMDDCVSICNPHYEGG
jgi:hypothetical protein